MRRNNISNDNSELDNQYLEVEEYVEVISTDDERIKIIGEELGNDTGRKIFTTITKGITSPNELSQMLHISLPLVNWHINRLMQVGLIRIEEMKMSSKNKPVRYYGPAKTVLVIVPPEGEQEAGSNGVVQKIQQRSKFDAIWSKLNKNIAAVISFVSSIPVIYTIKTMFMDGGSGGAPTGIQLADPEVVASVSGSSDIMIALLGGAIIGTIVLLTTRLVKK